jgi:hypothetical protein
MFKKPFILTLLVAVIATVGFVGYRSLPHADAQKQAAAIATPPTFAAITMGMSQAQVLSLVGPPKSKTVDPKWENKTPAEWAQIEQEAGDYGTGDGTDLQDGSVPIDFKRAKVASELSHRIKTTWTYPAGPNMAFAVSFDNDQKVMKEIVYPSAH